MTAGTVLSLSSDRQRIRDGRERTVLLAQVCPLSEPSVNWTRTNHGIRDKPNVVAMVVRTADLAGREYIKPQNQWAISPRGVVG